MSWFSDTQPLPSVGESPHSLPRRVVFFAPVWADILLGMLEYGQSDDFWAGDQSSKDQSVEWVQEMMDILTGVGIMEFCIASEIKAPNAHGGTTSDTTWHVRPLTDIVGNGDWYELNDPVITLQPGVYFIYARSACLAAARTRVRINVDGGTSYLVGASMWEEDNASIPSQGDAIILTMLSITEETDIKLEHYTQNGQATFGFGFASNTGFSEVYSQVTIVKAQ